MQIVCVFNRLYQAIKYNACALSIIAILYHVSLTINFGVPQAILDGCRYRRNSAAGLRRGTVTGEKTIIAWKR